jgi:DnaA-homolog protein
MTPTQLPLGVQLRDSSVFASYYPGRNQAAVDALLALRTQAPPRVVWLHGANAVGKTHLLQAICARASLRGERSAYLALSEFLTQGPEVLSGLGDLNWACLDAVEGIAGVPAWERRLFALHQEVEEQGGRLVLASAQTPQTLDFKLPDLASRLRGGLVLRLHALDESEQSAALKLRAELRGLELNEEVTQYLLRRLPRDMVTLCEFLDRLDRAALIAQRRLTIPFVKSVLES